MTSSSPSPRCRCAAAVLLLCVGVCAGADLPPGACRLDNEGERFTLEANDAPLSNVLAEIDAAIAPELRVSEFPPRRVTVRYLDVTLEQMLDRLDVSYVLSYDKTTGGRDYALSDARVFEGASPELRVFVSRARRAVANLRDDNERFNALNSMDELFSAGVKVIPELDTALRSDDYQTRQLAAQILAWFGTNYTPSEAFADVLIEGMQDDDYPYGEKGCMYVENARRGYEYFEQGPGLVDRFESKLAAHLGAGDAQRRFLCAVLLAQRGKTDYLDRLASILIPHLADNALSSDGGLAAHALHQLGPDVRRCLEPYARSEDNQQAKLASLIVWHLDHPGEEPPADPAIRRMNQAVNNPVLHKTPVAMGNWMPENFPDENGRYGEE